MTEKRRVWYAEKNGQVFTVLRYRYHELGWTDGTCLYYGRHDLNKPDFTPHNLAAQRHGGRFIYLDERLTWQEAEELMRE